jgi:hypothetical protein
MPKQGSLLSLLFIIFIFSMLLAANFKPLHQIIINKAQAVERIDSTIVEILILPLFLGTALFVNGRQSEDKRLKYIYYFSILPLIIKPDLLFFLPKITSIILNMLLDLVVVLIAIFYINSNYKRVDRPG